uniref:Uncharacterized protein n=1 Tax=Moniliophthora roreri TaxID=221103 RepID=A0A0W0EV98_MONRR
MLSNYSRFNAASLLLCDMELIQMDCISNNFYYAFTSYLESGILYPIFTIANNVYNFLVDPKTSGSALFSFSVVMYQVAGIAPTLIIIQKAGGKTIEQTSMNQIVSSLHFANSADPGSGNLDTRPHVQMVDIEASLSAERTENTEEENTA